MSRPVALFCVLMLTLTSLISCRGLKESEASLWVLHDAEGLANLEVYLDDVFVVEVAPGERSVPVGVSLGAHVLTVRSSGSTRVLLSEALTPLSARASVVVIRGDERELTLLEASQPFPEVSDGEHLIEIVDLSGLTEEFSVLLSGQEEGDFEGCTSPLGMTFTCPISTLPLKGEALISELIPVQPGVALSISTDHLSELRKVDLLEGEVTTVVIMSPSEDRISLTVLRTSL